MKAITILVLLMILTSCKSATKEDSMWSKINNTTWNKKNSWTGENYVFYEDNEGNKKCIHQFMGSGVYATSSNFIDVSFLDEFTLENNKLISKKEPTEILTKIADTPNVYGMFSQLDIEDVKKDTAVIPNLFNLNEAFGFEIFIFKKEDIANFNTEDIDYGENWQKFLNIVDLTNASLVLNSVDIDYYQWKTQKIYLTKEATSKLIAYNTERKNTKRNISQDGFIVSLSRKPIYAGKLLSHISAMSVNYPVIHYDISPQFIRIFPAHSIYPYSEFDKEIQNRTATKEIKDFFKNMGKLK